MHRRLLLPVYMPSFAMSLCQGSALLIIPLFALDLGAAASAAAIVFAMRGLGNMMMDVPAGYSVARFGDRTTMLGGIALLAITATGASLANSPLQLAAAALGLGAAISTWQLARLAHVTEAVIQDQRGRAISTMAGLQRLGTLIGPVASGIVADQLGFSAVFIGVAVIAIIAAVVVVLQVQPGPRQHAVGEHPPLLTMVPRILKSHAGVFGTIGVAMLLLTTIRSGRQLLIPLWGDHIGLSATGIGLVVGAAAAVDVAMFPVAGYLLDFAGRVRTALICIFTMALGLLAVPLTASAITLAAVAAFIGLGNGIGSGINQTLASDLAPKSERGEFLGVWRLIGDTGSLAGPLGISFVTATMTLAATFNILFGVGVAASVLLFVSRARTRCTPP
jgi:MFS family permease